MSTVLASNERRAAHGLHRCICCRLRIAQRETYLDLRIAYDGTVQTQRYHLACNDLLMRYGDWAGLDEDDWPDWDEVLYWERTREQSDG